MLKIPSLVFILCSLSGCGLGGFWMNGNPSVGKNIPALSDYWVKDDMVLEQVRKDWSECGGSSNGSYNLTDDDIASGELRQVSKKKFNGLQYCMMEKGYRYTGTCEGEIPSQYPACLLR